MSKVTIIVFGAGGHAKVVLDTLLQTPSEVVIIDDDDKKNGSMLMGVKITTLSQNFKNNTGFIIAIGDNAIRKQKFDQFQSKFIPKVAIHKLASVSDFSNIGAGTVVFAMAVIHADAQVSYNTIINTGAVIEHDCRIGAHAHIGPNATLCGGVNVGEGSLIGAGAVVLGGVNIGSWCVIGAGAVVTADVADKQVVVGCPATARLSRNTK